MKKTHKPVLKAETMSASSKVLSTYSLRTFQHISIIVIVLLLLCIGVSHAGDLITPTEPTDIYTSPHTNQTFNKSIDHISKGVSIKITTKRDDET